MRSTDDSVPQVPRICGQFREECSYSVSDIGTPRNDDRHALQLSVPDKRENPKGQVIKEKQSKLMALAKLMGLLIVNIEAIQWGRFHNC